MRRTLAIIAAAATVFDAVASWYSIEHLGVAAEGNPLLSTLASSIGFTGAMVVRALVGLVLIGVLYTLSVRSKRAGRLALIGLWVAAIALGAVALFHAYGLMFLV